MIHYLFDIALLIWILRLHQSLRFERIAKQIAIQQLITTTDKYKLEQTKNIILLKMLRNWR